MRRVVFLVTVSVWFAAGGQVRASLFDLGPEQLVQAGGVAVTVDGYSVPSYVDWNNDGRKDLIVGEGGSGGYVGRVRVYLNVGTSSNPQFSDFFYAQSQGQDLSHSYGCDCGCLGLFPRVVYWDGDGKKDLIVGTPEGTVILYRNVGSEQEPTFDAGTLLQVGPGGAKVDIDVGDRATPVVADWDNDGLQDLVVGAIDGQIRLFINQPSDTEPEFISEQYAMEDGGHLIVPMARSSPAVGDFDGDGKKDLLTGDTEGQLLFYSNVGTDESPVFSGYTLLLSAGEVIDLEGLARSRPFVCDWTGDGLLDILVGARDGKVHLYQGVPEPSSLCLVAVGLVGLIGRSGKARQRRRSSSG